MNVGVQYAPLIMVVCCVLHNFCRIKNNTSVVEGNELKDATLNNINLNRPTPPIFEQATSRVGNRIRDTLFNNWEKFFKRI